MAVEFVRQQTAAVYEEGTEVGGQRVFLVKFDAPEPDPDKAKGQTDPVTGVVVPTLAQEFSDTQPELIARRIRCEAHEDQPDVVRVTVEYGPAGGATALAPLDRPAQVSFGHIEFVETVYRALDVPTAVDADGNDVDIDWKWKKAVVNSAGGSFDPSIEGITFDSVIRVVRNVQSHNWAVARAYINSLNNDVFQVAYKGRVYSFQKGQARISEFSAVSLIEMGQNFDQETIEIQVREDGWDRKVLDQGLMELDNGDIPARHIVDADGNRITEPALLDGSGAILPNGDVPVFLVFRLNKYMDFGNLAL